MYNYYYDFSRLCGIETKGQGKRISLFYLFLLKLSSSGGEKKQTKNYRSEGVAGKEREK